MIASGTRLWDTGPKAALLWSASSLRGDRGGIGGAWSAICDKSIAGFVGSDARSLLLMLTDEEVVEEVVLDW